MNWKRAKEEKKREGRMTDHHGSGGVGEGDEIEGRGGGEEEEERRRRGGGGGRGGRPHHH